MSDDELARLTARVDDLLAANTREVIARRTAQEALDKAERALRAIATGTSPVTATTLAVLALHDIQETLNAR